MHAEDDILVPRAVELTTLLAISYALAQAARLEVLRTAVVHHCEMLRDLMFDFSALLTQVPRFVEQRSQGSHGLS